VLLHYSSTRPSKRITTTAGGRRVETVLPCCAFPYSNCWATAAGRRISRCVWSTCSLSRNHSRSTKPQSTLARTPSQSTAQSRMDSSSSISSASSLGFSGSSSCGGWSRSCVTSRSARGPSSLLALLPLSPRRPLLQRRAAASVPQHRKVALHPPPRGRQAAAAARSPSQQRWRARGSGVCQSRPRSSIQRTAPRLPTTSWSVSPAVNGDYY
jgi:hypothetical protein